MSSNPYAAPKAAVADAATALQGNFVPAGRVVPAGHGWDWIVAGWNLFKKQPGMWIGLVVVAMLIFFVMAIIPFIGSLALMVLGPVFAAGVMLGCKTLDEGGRARDRPSLRRLQGEVRHARRCGRDLPRRAGRDHARGDACSPGVSVFTLSAAAPAAAQRWASSSRSS